MAASSMVTVRFITTEPVRALITTLARAGATLTCRLSTCERNAAWASGFKGPRTCTTRPSSAVAVPVPTRPEEHTYELQSLIRNSYDVVCLKKKKYETKNPTD